MSRLEQKEKLYKKVNGKYVPISHYEFRGFPAAGLWLVTKQKYSRSASCICKLSDMDDLHVPTLAAMAQHVDRAAVAVREIWNQPISMCELVQTVMQAVAEGEFENQDKSRDNNDRW